MGGGCVYGLVGKRLGHSFSKKYFTEKFSREGINARYELYELDDINELPALVKGVPGLRGLNVTIPYKAAVLPLLHGVYGAAAEIGAVNTVLITGGTLQGYNTDCSGFKRSLVPLLRPWHKEALVLGSGGAAAAVCYALGQLGIGYTVVSRCAEKGMTYDMLTDDVVAEHKLVVNTTPLGMYAADGGAAMPALPMAGVGPQHLVYDLIYNPPRTRLLEEAAARGAMVKNGLEMLHNQAEDAWQIWTAANM